MPTVIAGAVGTLSAETMNALGRYRHDVFVKRQGWRLPMVALDDEVEWDEFDGPDAVYVVLRDRAARLCGCARLLPTTGPYLLRKLFPELAKGAPLNDPSVWELSRVAAVVVGDDRTGYAKEGDRMKALLCAVIAEAAKLRIVRLIGVAPPGMMRLYRQKGFVLEPEGPILRAGNEEIRQFSLLIAPHMESSASPGAHHAGEKFLRTCDGLAYGTEATPAAEDVA